MGTSEEGREEETLRLDPTLWLRWSELVPCLGSEDFSEKHDDLRKEKSLYLSGSLQDEGI